MEPHVEPLLEPLGPRRCPTSGEAVAGGRAAKQGAVAARRAAVAARLRAVAAGRDTVAAAAGPDASAACHGADLVASREAHRGGRRRPPRRPAGPRPQGPPGLMTPPHRSSRHGGHEGSAGARPAPRHGLPPGAGAARKGAPLRGAGPA